MKNKIILNLILTFLLTMLPVFSEQTKEQLNFNPKPESASLYNSGLKSYESGDIQSAITFFKQAVELDPNFVDAYYNLGAIYKKQKDYYNAITAFQKSADINPEDFEVVFELASSYFANGNYDLAKKYFSLVPLDFPKYAEARQNIEIINNSIASSNINTPNQRDFTSPSAQAQLLIDKLGRQNTEETPSVSIKQQEPVAITMPKKETFEGNFKVISGNFFGPTGIAKDSLNNLYIANFSKDTIEKISPGGKREVFVDKIGLNGPLGLATDENDNLFIANYNEGTIVRVTQEKEISIIATRLSKPYFLFYDTNTKKLFVTVQGNNTLVQIDTANLSQNPVTSR